MFCFAKQAKACQKGYTDYVNFVHFALAKRSKSVNSKRERC